MRSLFILGFSLVTLAANQLAVLAQTRQPTNAEIKRLHQELQESIRHLKNNSTVAHHVEDRRTQAEKNERESFVRAWSKIEPSLAPFMGAWHGYESSRYIYPSNTKGRACVVVREEGIATFNTGVLFNGVIRTNNGGLLFKEGDFLGSVLLEKGRFIRNYETPFHHPRPLEPLTKMLDSLYDASPAHKNQIAQQFKAAGCTYSVATLKPENTSNNNSSLADPQAEPSIISSSTPVMFQKLETLLQAGKWKDADLETWELMKKVTKREKEGELTKEDYQNFPKKELQIMDQLWLKYSNGKFGFSVQKQIWLELGGKYNGQHYDMNTFLKLVERVGWTRNRIDLSYNDFTFSTNAPRGHLPTGELASGRGQTGLLFSRL